MKTYFITFAAPTKSNPYARRTAKIVARNDDEAWTKFHKRAKQEREVVSFVEEKYA